MINPNVQEVCSFIDHGGIPVIKFCRDHHLRWTFIVGNVEAQTDYIAISHVWSDGLADPRTNGLFECGISRLTQDMQWLDVTWLWVDALCVPCYDSQNDERSKALKQRVFSLMALTYTGASPVLVTDKGLQTIEYSTYTGTTEAKSTELLEWLRLLPWMGRCWTLPEGALPPHYRLFGPCGPHAPFFEASILGTEFLHKLKSTSET